MAHACTAAGLNSFDVKSANVTVTGLMASFSGQSVKLVGYYGGCLGLNPFILFQQTLI